MGDHEADASTHGIQQCWVDRIVVLSVQLDLDMLGTPHLDDAIQAAFAKAPSALIVDLTKVEFLASAGIAALAAARQQAGSSVGFAVVADGPATSRPLKVLDMDDFLSLYATLDDAVRALR